MIETMQVHCLRKRVGPIDPPQICCSALDAKMPITRACAVSSAYDDNLESDVDIVLLRELLAHCVDPKNILSYPLRELRHALT
jgi:hypothetical protein